METMRMVILVFLLGLFLQADAQSIPDACLLSNTNRPPENSDLNVTCGSQFMDLSIYLCPVYNTQYNESLMVLNNQISNSLCFGTPDFNVTPPILRFRVPINATSVSICNNKYEITNQVGTGQWADYSNVQFINISGTITAIDPSIGAITYRQQILYKFSCSYPLQYLLNNTQLNASSVSVAIRDNSGSFISTLIMQLYKDKHYQEPLTIPSTGLNLKTKIYVEVKAANLTEKFHLLLDRCYATTTPFPTQNNCYDLFVGCDHDAQTTVDANGVSHRAHFNFEAFRFVDHRNLTVSTFFLHCTTRLCEAATCSSFLPNCNATSGRRKRATEDVSTNTTVTSPPIRVGEQSAVDTPAPPTNQAASSQSTNSHPNIHSRPEVYSSPVVAIIVCIIILIVLIAILAAYFVFYIRRRNPLINSE